MPLVTPFVAGSLDSGTRRVVLPGLPTFNEGARFVVDSTFVSWFAPGGREVALVERGSGPGATLARTPRRKAKFPTLSGSITCSSRAEVELMLRLLWAAFPDAADSPVTVLGDYGVPDLTAWFRLYDEPEVDIIGDWISFSLPLIQTDPFCYAATLGGSMGVFTGSGFYHLYTLDGGEPYRTYEVALLSPEVRNLITKPSFEVDTAGWAASGGALTRSSEVPGRAGSSVARVAATGAGTDYAGITSFGVLWIPVTAGTTYPLSAHVRSASTTRAVRLKLLWADAAQAILRADDLDGGVITSTSEWNRGSITATAPAGATQVSVDAYVSGSLVAGEVHYFDALMLHEGIELLPYGDGDSSGWVWDGVAHASASRLPSNYDSTRTYQTDDAAGGLPDSVNVVNSGDMDSRRFVVDVTGPLSADDYEVVSDTTGQRLSPGVTLAAGQSMSLDMHNRRAVLGGTVVTEFVSGDWLKLAPGSNILRLFSGSPNGTAMASVTDPQSAYQ